MLEKVPKKPPVMQKAKPKQAQFSPFSKSTLSSVVLSAESSPKKLDCSVEAITETSHIDWEDLSRLEAYVIKQQSLENLKTFDPKSYFGGIDIQDLNRPPRDQRLSDMFKDPHVLKTQELKTSPEKVVLKENKKKPLKKN
jgi:hypothetical protein